MEKSNWSMFLFLIGVAVAIQLCVFMLIVIEPKGELFYSNDFKIAEIGFLSLACIVACIAAVLCIRNLGRMRSKGAMSYALATITIIYGAFSIWFLVVLPLTWGIVA